MTDSKGCTFCIRRGLPILPVRPALMAQSEPLPVLPGSIVMPVQAQGESAYTTRLLREGFLYIYDEMVKGWLDYYVTSEGYYYPLPAKGPVPPDLVAGKTRPCASSPSDMARASLITLPVMPSGKKNGLFWFGWSQVQWTSATRKKHEDAGYRTCHMQRFDMDAWLGTAQGQNVLKLTALKTVVAEYSAPASVSKIKDYSGAVWKSFKNKDADALLSEAQNLLADKGAMVFLQDPTAVLQDISSLITYQLDRYIYQNPEYKREVALLSAITMLKKTLREQFAREMVLESENYEELERRSYTHSVPGDIRADISAKKSDATLNARVDAKWADYEQYYDTVQVETFRETFQVLLNKYNASIVAPMTEMYLKWIQGENTNNYFLHNFDPMSPENGIAYVETVSQCVQGMQDKLGTQIYFRDKLLGDPNDTTNIVARALSLNQKTLIEATQKAMQGNPDWINIQWNAVADTYKTTLDRMAGHSAGVVGKLVALLGGPLMGAINRSLSSGVVFHAMVSLGALSNKAIVTVTKTGTRKEFVSQVVRQLAIEGGMRNTSATDSLRHYVERELRRLHIDGLPLEGEQTKTFIAMIDSEKAAELRDLSEAERGRALAGVIKTTASVEAEQFTRWQGSVARGIQNSRQAFPFLLGAISVAFQSYALYESMDYKGNTLTRNQEEAQNRFMGNVAAGIGTIFGIVESGLKQMNWLGSTPSLKRIIGYKSVEWGGKFFGAAGGAVAAYYDFSHAVDEWQKGTEHRGLAILYGFQTAADIILMIACLITIPVWGIVAAVIVLLVTSISILFVSQTKIQEWLESCLWRRVPGNVPKDKWPAPWPTMEMEMNELKLALEEGV
ncbi:MAG: hypothetical protein LBU96_07160 [Yokenella regensburgei]|jgi:hypothetical protein|nr:hypothetical protein [Yokenella regensburgei]